MENRRLLVISNHLPKNQTIQVTSIIKSIERSRSINQIELLHIKPFVAAHCFALPSMVQFLEQCHQQAEESLIFWGELLDVSTKHQWSSNGSIGQEITSFSKHYQTEFVVCSHELKQHFKPKFNLFGKPFAKLLRAYGCLDFYTTQQTKQTKRWRHPIAHAV